MRIPHCALLKNQQPDILDTIDDCEYEKFFFGVITVMHLYAV